MDLNRITLVGQVTQDQASRGLGGRSLLSKFTVATTSRREDGTEEHVEYFAVVAFGRLAEKCTDLLRNGRLVYVEGRVRTVQFEDERKVLHTRTEVRASQIVLLDRNQCAHQAVKQRR